jgi:hypothetical protein
VRAVDAPARCITAGTRGRVQTAVGVWLPFEITHWEEGRAWCWTVAGVPATGHLIEATGPDSCRVTFTIPRGRRSTCPCVAPRYVPLDSSRPALNSHANARPRTCTMPMARKNTNGQKVNSHRP